MISGDIIRAWRHPRQVMRRRLDDGVREDRALIYLIVGCLLIFVAQWPRLWRDTVADPAMPFDARIGGAMLAWMFFVPLACYGIAVVGRILAQVFGGTGSWYSARLALFWSLLVAAPLWLVNGLVAGLIGSGAMLELVGVVGLAVFVIVWAASMYEAEKGE